MFAFKNCSTSFVFYSIPFIKVCFQFAEGGQRLATYNFVWQPLLWLGELLKVLVTDVRGRGEDNDRPGERSASLAWRDSAVARRHNDAKKTEHLAKNSWLGFYFRQWLQRKHEWPQRETALTAPFWPSLQPRKSRHSSPLFSPKICHLPKDKASPLPWYLCSSK